MEVYIDNHNMVHILDTQNRKKRFLIWQDFFGKVLASSFRHNKFDDLDHHTYLIEEDGKIMKREATHKECHKRIGVTDSGALGMVGQNDPRVMKIRLIHPCSNPKCVMQGSNCVVCNGARQIHMPINGMTRSAEAEKGPEIYAGPVKVEVRPPQIAPISAQQPTSVVSELRDLVAMHKEGLLSDAEFSASKAKLVGPVELQTSAQTNGRYGEPDDSAHAEVPPPAQAPPSYGWANEHM